VAHGKGYEANLTKEEIFGACAGAALYRAEVFNKVGLLDPSFHTTLEDVDLSWRIRLAGYKSMVEPKSVVLHIGGVSRQKRINLKARSGYIGSRNTLMIYTRYFPFEARYFIPYAYHLVIAIISAILQNRLVDLHQNLHLSKKMRRLIKRQSLLTELQRQWLK